MSLIFLQNSSVVHGAGGEDVEEDSEARPQLTVWSIELRHVVWLACQGIGQWPTRQGRSVVDL